jgi:glutaredoxin-like protein
MPNLLPKDVAAQIGEILAEMKDPVTLVYFTDRTCQTCLETGQLLTEIAALNPKISLDVKDYPGDREAISLYGVERIPFFVVLDKDGRDRGVRFSGIPAGHEINSFLAALMEMSGAAPSLPQDLLDRIARIDKPVDIKVFVTLTCPHCPGAVQTAHLLAMNNPNVRGEMIEAQTFQDLSRKYKVSGVPKIVINETHEFLGNQPPESFLDLIESL